MSGKRYRLVTRSDFDGLVCGVLLKHMDLVDEIKFVHPKDMQDGKVAISNNDITTNLPYVEGVHLAFDHHLSETVRVATRPDNHIIDPKAPSAARVVFDWYGGEKSFPAEWKEMMEAVDKSDSAAFSESDILDPQGWDILSFVMDARTGLGRFRDFRIANYQLMMELIDYCRNHTIDEILQLPDVAERIALYREHAEPFKEQLKRCTTLHGKVAVLDLRNEETIYAGNRFLIYALFPESNVSIHVLWGLNRQNTVFATGKSILDRSCNSNIGQLMLEYGGGGHNAAGTCQVANEVAEEKLAEVVARLQADG